MNSEQGERLRWAALVGIGLVGGLLSGLFAIGGGIIMVPLLITFAKLNQRAAAATSLAAIVPTAIVGSVTYLLAGQIDLVAGLIISIGAVGGAVLGSALLRRIPLTWLRWMFIVFILLVAARMLLITPERGHTIQFTPLVGLGYVVLGLIMGVLSGLFGIGGGIVAVPALVGVFAISDLVAKGTSLLVMIPTSVVGTVANWRAGTVNVRAGLVVGVAATVASVPGAALALALPAR
ncbi:MAG TPA: sulfite exporter TauE/SafE family protein, partial [Leifsonia sp.]|nr:sulfite exporter TauE/SafE family protein [Leifsonia sp.]